MNQPVDPAHFDANRISDPSIDAATLAHLAQFRPDLWDGILGHPNCYPGLTEWIKQNQAAYPIATAEEAASLPDSRDSDETTVFRPVAGSAADAGPAAASSPSAASYANTSESDETTVFRPVVSSAAEASSAAASSPSAASAWQHDTRRSEQDSHPGQNAWQQPGSASAAQPTDRSAAQQFGEGTKQIAAGAARGFRSAVDTQNKEIGPAKLLGWLPLILAGLSLLAVGAMFFPSARIIYRNESTDEPFKIPDGSASFYGSSQGHIGIYLVIVLAVTIVLAALAFATRRLWARIGAAVAGLAAGILGLIAGFGAASGNKLDFSDAIRSHFEDALPSLFHRYSDYFGDYDADDIREEIDDLISDSSVWRLIDIKLGFGAIILGILAILIVIVALLVAVPPRKVNDLAASAAAANQESTGKQQAWDQPAQQTWGQPAQPQNPYGQQQNPYGQTPTAQQPKKPYGQQQNPYGQPQTGQDPYGQPQPGQDPYGRNQD